jgi:hypothetical protein
MIGSFGELLAHWTARELADELGVNYQTAASMKRRSAVSTRYWARLLGSARNRGVEITYEMLAEFHAEGKTVRESPAEPEAA